MLSLRSSVEFSFLFFLSFNLLICCITLIDLRILKNPGIPGTNPTWSWLSNWTELTTEGDKRKNKIQKNLQYKSKHKNNKCFSWVTAVRVISLTGSHSLPHVLRIPFNSVLISGPAVGAAQILIWSYSCVFLPTMSTAIRTSVFSFVSVFNVLLYIP